MTLQKDSFLAGLAVLAGAFGREVDGAVQRAYYQVLSQRMTDAEFEQAVSLVLESETFWPSPAVILGKVKADDESRGLAALEHVNRVTSAHGGYRFLPHAVYHEQFDAPTRAAISAVGGLYAMANTTEGRLSTMHRKFVEAYAEAANPTKRIAQPPIDNRVKQLVGKTAKVMDWKERASGGDT